MHPTTTLDAEVEEHAIQFLQPAAPRVAWLFVSRLTFGWSLASLGQRLRGEWFVLPRGGSEQGQHLGLMP